MDREFKLHFFAMKRLIHSTFVGQDLEVPELLTCLFLPHKILVGVLQLLVTVDCTPFLFAFIYIKLIRTCKTCHGRQIDLVSLNEVLILCDSGVPINSETRLIRG